MKRSTFRRVRNSSLRPVLPLLSLLLAAGSWRSAQRVGEVLGRLAWGLAGRDRRRTLDHLAIAFPDLDTESRMSIARQTFEHLGTSAAEFLYLSRRQPDLAAGFLDIEGWEHVERAQDQGRGTLIATGHCGNWELLGPAFRSRKTPLAAIARSFEEGWVNEQATALRQRLGTEMIRRGEKRSARQLLQLFRRGGNLLVLVDHDIEADSVWVPFFGTLAHTVVGPAQMAIRHSLAVIPAFCERRANGRHTVRFHPSLADFEDAVELTAMMTAAVERQIRRCPSQWTWMHRRWRRRPPEQDPNLERD